MLFWSKYCLVPLALLVLITGYVSAGAQPVLSDDERLQALATQAFYSVPLQAVRKHNGFQEFLFLADAPARQKFPSGLRAGRIVLARRIDAHEFRIIWQYALPSEGINAVWWNPTASDDKSAILVTLYDGSGLTFHDLASTPELWHQFTIDDGGGMPYVDPGKTFFGRLNETGGDSIFFEHDALFALDIATGSESVVFSLPNRLETSAAYLAVQDLDGDGVSEIVADTSRFITGKAPVAYPSSLRVWHIRNSSLVEVWRGAPRDLITRQSFVFSSGRGLRPSLVTHEETPAFTNPKHDFLCMYLWDGKKLNQVASLDTTLTPIVDRGFVPVFLDKSGTGQIVAIEGFGVGSIHISVIGLKNNKFVEIWKSASLRSAPRFGRVDDYDNAGQQEVPLFDEGKVFLFRQSGSKFVGWEGLKALPPPPAPLPLEAGIRLDAIQYQANVLGGPFQTFLVLDGKKIKEINAVPLGRSAFDRANDIRSQIALLASRKFPAAQVVSRKVGDEDEEPKREVVAGKTVVITLTQSEAKAAGKPLPALASEWVSAVRQALTTLAAPPK